MSNQLITFQELSFKRALTFPEAAIYLGYAESYLRKLVLAGSIPYSKPSAKKITFDRLKLDDWLLGNPSTPREKVETEASTYITSNNKQCKIKTK